ncbi:MAG: D-2-hydroxyacid dehydrogenase [Oscillospiraceae bacterium]|nr:D-2-hydroxyacid dehydrogenase [Oscillospiraceae bacterium]
MMRILVTDGMDKGAQAKLAEMGHEVVNQFFEPDELGKALRDFDVVIIRSKTKIRKQQIDEAKGSKLKTIIRAGVGVDNIDVAYAEENGIAVKNTPRASSQSVAELAMAHMFSCARSISAAGQTMREGKWEKKTYSAGFELCGKTLGIIGFGRIGQKLCAMAKGVGMDVIAYDVYHVPGIEQQLGMRYAELEDLLKEADILSLHTPAIDGKPLVREETIAKMKDGVVIINTSRGGNVCEEDLLKALDSGKVRAAGLDVFAEEPAQNAALYTHPHVSSTPHIGAGTNEAQARIGAELVEIISKL